MAMIRTKPPKPKAEKTRMQIGSLIDSALYRQARALALMQQRNVGELIDEALRDYFAKHGLKPTP
jgi:hypothetical protein